MNYFYYFFIASALFLLASCSSDDDNGPTLSPEEVLVGTWEQTESYTEVETAIPGFLSSTSTSNGRDFAGTVTFNSNPNTWESNLSATYDFVITSTSLGVTETDEFSSSFVQDNETGTWSVNDDGQLVGVELQVPEDAEGNPIDIDQVYNIEVVNNNRVILTFDFNFIQVDPVFGLDMTVMGSGRGVLQRK